MEEDTEKTVTAGADKDLMYAIMNMNAPDVAKMLAMVADSTFGLETVMRRVRELKENNRISEGAFNAFVKKLQDLALAKGTLQPGQKVVAQPLSKKEAEGEPKNGA